MYEASTPPVPVTEAKRRVRVPSGVAVDGVACAVEPGVLESKDTNWRFAGRFAETSRLVTVWPGATVTSTRYWRGNSGPLAVSPSGAMNAPPTVMTAGVVEVLTVEPLIVGSVAGFWRASAPKVKPACALIDSGVPTRARFETAALMTIWAWGWALVNEPNGSCRLTNCSPAGSPHRTACAPEAW